MNIFEVNYDQILEEAYNNHNNLIVCFDFDNTIYDYHKKGLDCSPIIGLLKRCDKLGFTLICSTSDWDEEELIFKSKWIEKELGLRVGGLTGGRVNEGDGSVNEWTLMNETKKYIKPYANIYLDDKAGLKESFDRLNRLVTKIENSK